MPAPDERLGGYALRLGQELTEATADRVSVRWCAQEALELADFAAAIEGAASVGASLWWGERGRCVGITNQTTVLAEATDGPFTAVATPAGRGQRHQLWRVEVTDGHASQCATGDVLLANLTS